MESVAAIAMSSLTPGPMPLPSAEAPLRLAQLPEELIVFVAAQLGGIDAMASFGRASRSCCEAVRKCRASLALFTSDWVWQSDVESPSGIMVHGETVVLLSGYSLLQLWPDETYMVRRGTSLLQFTVFVPTQTDASHATVACTVEGDVEPEGGVASKEAFPTAAANFSYSVSGSVTTVSLTLSADAPAGRANVVCEVTPPGGGTPLVGTKAMIVLFNTYSPLDATYMENENDRSEYLINGDGVIFQVRPTLLLSSPPLPCPLARL